MIKSFRVCEKCNCVVEDNEFVTIKVVIGKRERSIAEETANELTIDQSVDLCNKCAAQFLKILISKNLVVNSPQHTALKECLSNFGVRLDQH